jgi:two-component system response regulator FixJ
MNSLNLDDAGTVYVVDDEPTILRIAHIFLQVEFSRVQTFASGEEFLAYDGVDDVGCVIADLRLPGIQGGDLLPRLRERGSQLAVVVMSGAADVAIAVKLMKEGVVTVLEKPFSREQLLAAAHEGMTQSRRQALKRRQLADLRQRMAQLTEDETEVLRRLVKGVPHKTIASELNLGLRTVDRRRQAILQKMGVSTIQELCALTAIFESEANPSALD